MSSELGTRNSELGTDEAFMQRALELAARAAAEGEVPVGAVITRTAACVVTAPPAMMPIRSNQSFRPELSSIAAI